MNKSFIAAAVSAAALAYALPASADERLIRFDGGIGSQPLRAGGLVNDVRGVAPGGRPWVISSLRADIRTDGSISVDGRGLLLGGGEVASNAGQSVKATLICTTAIVAPATTPPLIDTAPPVQLDENGDFRIEGTLSLPAECPSPILLIRSAGGAWFAAGIPKR